MPPLFFVFPLVWFALCCDLIGVNPSPLLRDAADALDKLPMGERK